MDSDEVLRNPLKNFSMKELETKIASVLSEATGTTYNVNISSIDYSHRVSETRIVLTAWKKRDLSWSFTGNSDSSEEAVSVSE